MLEEIFKRLFDAAELAAMDAQTRRLVDKTMTTKIDTLQHLHNTYVDGHLDGEKVGHADGLAEGLAKGRAEQSKADARRFLKMGYPIEDVAKGTGLSVEEVKALR
jgi:predicted transposase/invertase (TIGR01784 family)